MENNHDIDKKFNEASKLFEEPATFPGFDKVWAKVEEKLDHKENKKRIIPAWFPYGIAASLVIGLGAFYFITKNDAPEIERTSLAEKTVSPEKSSNVQTIDSTIKSNIEKEIAVKDVPKSQENTLVYNNIVPGPLKAPAPPTIINEDYTVAASPVYSEIDNDGVSDNEDKAQRIEEVVMVGLGQKRKVQSLTGSVSTITPQQIQQPTVSSSVQGRVQGVPIIAAGSGRNRRQNNSNIRNEFQQNNNVPQSLVGTVSGLAIASNTGSPGSGNIMIRGAASLNGKNAPLYVVNGRVSSAKVLQSMNAQEIESIQVLKDASATALYGSRAANGVVIIKTKKLSRKERKIFKRLQKIEDSIIQSKQIQQYNAEEYDAFVENPFELTKSQPLSTFSIDVDKAAYSNIRRMINNGESVNKNAVRIEEMINYFKYDYPQPKNEQPFSINTEYSDAPWNPKHKLLKIGLQGKNIPTGKLPSSNFVFLIDVSGSMDAANKLPLLKSSFKVLLDQLRPQDKIGIVVYAGNAGMVLPPTSAKEKGKIIDALDKLQAGGSTAGGEGIELAYKLAQENFIKGGNNRVIIATDGDFNVGASSTGDLQTLIEEKRKSGVFLTCLGFGMGNFKDNHMETLANKGNGNYAYIDNMQEANKFLGKEFAGSMYAIAKDVKIQIEFNPEYVKSYRLIGYENRKLKNEDFTNDKIDAGELGSGHTVTALYEVIPSDVNSEFLPKENDLKYSKNTNDENFNDELATVKFRYKKPDDDKSTELIQVVKNTDLSISSASIDFKFASSVAWFGLVLRKSDLIKNRDVREIESLAKKGRGKDEDGYRAEFLRLVEAYKTSVK